MSKRARRKHRPKVISGQPGTTITAQNPLTFEQVYKDFLEQPYSAYRQVYKDYLEQESAASHALLLVWQEMERETRCCHPRQHSQDNNSPKPTAVRP